MTFLQIFDSSKPKTSLTAIISISKVKSLRGYSMSAPRQLFDMPMIFEEKISLGDLLNAQTTNAKAVKTNMLNLLKSSFSDENFKFLQELHAASNNLATFKNIISTHIDSNKHEGYYVNIENALIKKLKELIANDDATFEDFNKTDLIREVTKLTVTNITNCSPSALSQRTVLYEAIKNYKTEALAIQTKVDACASTLNFNLNNKFNASIETLSNTDAEQLSQSLSTLKDTLITELKNNTSDSNLTNANSQIASINRLKNMINNCLQILNQFNPETTTQKILLAEFANQLNVIIDNSGTSIRPDIICQDLNALVKGIIEQKKVLEKEPLIGDSPFLKSFKEITTKAENDNSELKKVPPEKINILIFDNQALTTGKFFNKSTQTAIEKLCGSEALFKSHIQTLSNNLYLSHRENPDWGYSALKNLVNTSLHLLNNYSTDNIHKQILIGMLAEKLITISQNPTPDPNSTCKDFIGFIKGLKEKNIQLENRMSSERANQSNFAQELQAIIDTSKNTDLSLINIPATPISTPTDLKNRIAPPVPASPTSSIKSVTMDSEEPSMTRSRSGSPR